MAIKETMYETGANGYKAMVSDITEMFSWDEIEPNEGADTFTRFKKYCGGNAYIGLRIYQGSASNPPYIDAIGDNGILYFGSNLSFKPQYVGYSYGDGYFALGASNESMPNAKQLLFAGVSSCRNILTGETSWCSFIVSNTSGSVYSYYLLTKNMQALTKTSWDLTFNAKIGAAVALHDPKTGFVADKIMELTAVPDNYQSCIAPVVFNGARYTRIGPLLVPA